MYTVASRRKWQQRYFGVRHSKLNQRNKRCRMNHCSRCRHSRDWAKRIKKPSVRCWRIIDVTGNNKQNTINTEQTKNATYYRDHIYLTEEIRCDWLPILVLGGMLVDAVKLEGTFWISLGKGREMVNEIDKPVDRNSLNGSRAIRPAPSIAHDKYRH